MKSLSAKNIIGSNYIGKIKATHFIENPFRDTQDILTQPHPVRQALQMRKSHFQGGTIIRAGMFLFGSHILSGAFVFLRHPYLWDIQLVPQFALWFIKGMLAVPLSEPMFKINKLLRFYQKVPAILYLGILFFVKLSTSSNARVGNKGTLVFLAPHIQI